MEKNELFRVSRENAEWLREHYDDLKRDYDENWIVIKNQKVVETASSFDEVLRIIKNKKYNPNTIIVEYMQSEQVAMFF